jgi:hypothetical protein
MPDNLWIPFQKHHPNIKEVILEVPKAEPVKVDPVKVEIAPLNEPTKVIQPTMDIKPEPKVEPKPEPKTASFNELEKLKEEKIENTRVKRRRPAQGKHR